jgi:hypothetical protein
MSDVASSVDVLSQSSTQITDKIMVSDDDSGESLKSKTVTSDVTSCVYLLSQLSTQITDKITVSDDDPGELLTSKTDMSDVASSVDVLSQSSIQISDKIMESDDDLGEFLTSKTVTSDVASSVYPLFQSSTQNTDKITLPFYDPGGLFTSETDTSYVTSSVDLLPQSAKNVSGVIDDLWMRNSVLMTAKLKGFKMRVLIYGKNLYINRQQCPVKSTNWQHLVQGMKVFADISKLKDHPSGALYQASFAWYRKKPGNGSPCDITAFGTEECVKCPKKAFSSDIDPSTSGSKMKSVAGRQKSKHCKTDGFKYPTENTETCREKPVLNGKSCSGQLKVDSAVEELKQVYHKASRSVKTLVDRKYVGTVERYTMDEGFGVVNFQLENDKARAVFFREHIFAEGVSVTDSYVKNKITAGRLVTVSAVKPYIREDIPYAVHIDTEFQDTKVEPATLSYSVAATQSNEQEEVAPALEDLEFESNKFCVKVREMYYKSRLCYNWDQGSVTDGDIHNDTEVMEHPIAPKVERQSYWGMTIGDGNVAASLNNKADVTDHHGEGRGEQLLCWGEAVGNGNVAASSDKNLEVRDKPNGVEVEKQLRLDKPMLEADKSGSLYTKDNKDPGQSDKVKADKPLCQEGTVDEEMKIDKPSCREGTDRVVTTSLGKQQLMQLPVTSTPHTGLARQLKGQVATVKRYESSMRGILEFSICGMKLEIAFDRSVVQFCEHSEVTDVRERLPVDSTIYFDGEVLGEDSLLGCSDIVVTSVSQPKTHRKPSNSKLTHSVTLELPFLHEGLVTGRIYEGIVTKVNPPRAFVATVTEDDKTYDVFVLNTFFSPAEYGAKLPAKQSVLPFVAKGYKVQLIVERTHEVNSKYKYDWFALDAWTEAGDNSFTGNKLEKWFTSEEMDGHKVGMMKADCHDHLEGVIDVDHHDYREGVIMTLYPEWGVLNPGNSKEEVTFFAQDAFLFGVRLTSVDLRTVFRHGKSHYLFTYSLCGAEPFMRS